MPSLLLVFDFDRTVLENEGDTAAMSFFNKKEEALKKWRDDGMQWTRMCDYVFSQFNKKQIEECVEKSFIVHDGMYKIMNDIADYQQGLKPFPSSSFLEETAENNNNNNNKSNITSIKLAVCSDSNEFFIRHAFKTFFPRTKLDFLYTNCCRWERREKKKQQKQEQKEGEENDVSQKEEEKKEKVVVVDEDELLHLRVEWAEPDSHNCSRCLSGVIPLENMCKGIFIQRHIQYPAQEDQTIWFIGDGFNDCCAAVTLRSCDCCFVRRGFSLQKCLLKKNKVICESSPVTKNEHVSVASSAATQNTTTTTTAAATTTSTNFATPSDAQHEDEEEENNILFGQEEKQEQKEKEKKFSNNIFTPPRSINCENYRGACKLVPWTNGADLYDTMMQHELIKLGQVPSLHLFGCGGDNTFRGYSQRVRVPTCLRSSLTSSVVAKHNNNKAISLQVEKLANEIENDLVVNDEINKDWCYSCLEEEDQDQDQEESEISATTNNNNNHNAHSKTAENISPFDRHFLKTKKRTWKQMPWLLGEQALHRRLFNIIVQQQQGEKGETEQQEKQQQQENKSLTTPENDFWLESKIESVNHTLPWLIKICEETKDLWSTTTTKKNDLENNNSSSFSNKTFLTEEFQKLLMYQLQGNIADLCFRASSDLSQMFEPPLVLDNRKKVVDYILEEILGFDSSSEKKEEKEEEEQNLKSLVDIVCDNAGAELAADLVFSACLVGCYINNNKQKQNKSKEGEDKKEEEEPKNENKKSKNCCIVRLLVKNFPYYVSDVVEHDIDILLKILSEGIQQPTSPTSTAAQTQNPLLNKFAETVSSYIKQGFIEVKIINFGTSVGEFSELGFETSIFGFKAPRNNGKNKINLGKKEWKYLEYEEKQQQKQQQQQQEQNEEEVDEEQHTDPLIFQPHTKLVVIKGDLNYRRVVGDRTWTPCTPFETCLQRTIFQYLPTICIRTLKCEVLVGMQKEKFEELNSTLNNDPVKGWRVDGQRGVISFAKPSSSSSS